MKNIKNRLCHLWVFLFFVLGINAHAQKYQDLAKTPPMGWNSWNRFGCNISEKLILETANAMVKSGMKAAGYNYLVIDDCWHGERDSLGFIHPDPVRFPSGMKALADKIHSMGLKIGIYSDAGVKTCMGKPGSRGYEYQDALTYASWGIDYLKYDWCNTGKLNAEEAYLTMRDALFAAKRPVVFSICECGENQPWNWATNVGHLWRTTGDIYQCFDCEWGHGIWTSYGILSILDMQVDLRSYAGPGHWNDPDMLEVGNGMTGNEDRAHFSMWCMISAPLMAGNDLRNMSKETIAILTNKEVIEIDQDSLGIQGYKMLDYGDLEIWVKPLADSALAVCFLNRNHEPITVDYDWKQIPIKDALSGLSIDFRNSVYQIRDLWSREAVGNTSHNFKVSISGHDVVMLKLHK